MKYYVYKDNNGLFMSAVIYDGYCYFIGSFEECDEYIKSHWEEVKMEISGESKNGDICS